MSVLCWLLSKLSAITSRMIHKDKCTCKSLDQCFQSLTYNKFKQQQMKQSWWKWKIREKKWSKNIDFKIVAHLGRMNHDKGNNKGHHAMENSKGCQSLETRLNEQSYCTGKVLRQKEGRKLWVRQAKTDTKWKGYAPCTSDSNVKEHENYKKSDKKARGLQTWVHVNNKTKPFKILNVLNY